MRKYSQPKVLCLFIVSETSIALKANDAGLIGIGRGTLLANAFINDVLSEGETDLAKTRSSASSISLTISAIFFVSPLCTSPSRDVIF